jgi:DNA-binding transcriptional LysR family regulator
MLSVNDHIVQIVSPNSAAQIVRIGVPGDCMGAELVAMLSASRARWPHLRFAVQGGGERRLLQVLKQGDIDLVWVLVTEEPADTARHYWTEELAWVRAKSTTLDPNAPVPLVSYREASVRYRVGVAAIEKAGLAFELVFRGSNAEALRSAAAAGLGVMVATRRRVPAGLEVWDDGPLPPLPPVFCGIFVREGAGSDMLDQLADYLAQTMRPSAVASDPMLFASPPLTPPVAARSAF